MFYRSWANREIEGTQKIQERSDMNDKEINVPLSNNFWPMKEHCFEGGTKAQEVGFSHEYEMEMKSNSKFSNNGIEEHTFQKQTSMNSNKNSMKCSISLEKLSVMMLKN